MLCGNCSENQLKKNDNTKKKFIHYSYHLYHPNRDTSIKLNYAEQEKKYGQWVTPKNSN